MEETIQPGAGLFDSDISAVCSLFACQQPCEVFEILRDRAQTPLQVPFYYLQLIRSGVVKLGSQTPLRPTPEQVELGYRAILQRPPESDAIVREHCADCVNLEDLITRLLASREAVQFMPRLHARAFPLQRRLWHVHIPKTAGSSFCGAALECGWGSNNINMLQGAEGKLDLLARAVVLPRSPGAPTLITGHWRLMQHLDVIGPFDRVVVFVRDPIERCVSEYNYFVDVLKRRPNVHQSDPQPILDAGFDPESFVRSYERGFFQPNLQCNFLADDSTCGSALANLARFRYELLPSSATSWAIAKYFPQASRRRLNISTKCLRSADVAPRLREKIFLQCGQDHLLNQIAETRFAELRAHESALHLHVPAEAPATPRKTAC